MSNSSEKISIHENIIFIQCFEIKIIYKEFLNWKKIIIKHLAIRHIEQIFVNIRRYLEIIIFFQYTKKSDYFCHFSKLDIIEVKLIFYVKI